jgi:phosphoribosyl-AMP cyclohydrolase
MDDAQAVALRLDSRGLIPAVIQDDVDGRVLMLGYMNLEAFHRTLERGIVHFWSRSRQELWCKGETSGHTQTVKEVRLDCDGDALLVRVEQRVAACHTGHRSCFFRKWSSDGWEEADKPVFDPSRVYEKKS